MRHAAVVTAMVAAIAPATMARGQSARIDPVESPRMFREAVLGYCAERVQGRALVAHQIDPSGPDWVDVRSDVQTSGGQRIFAGRVNISTGIIIDVSPGGGTCFVQVNLASPVLPLADELRSEIMRAPHATLLDDVNTPEGHGTIYGLVDPDIEAVSIFSVTDSGPDGAVATAIVGLGSKGT